jgi:hypothetical protein
MAEEIVRLCLAEGTTDREALVDFLAEFIDAGIAGIAPGTWGAVERSRSPVRRYVRRGGDRSCPAARRSGRLRTT